MDNLIDEIDNIKREIKDCDYFRIMFHLTRVHRRIKQLEFELKEEKKKKIKKEGCNIF